MRVTATSRLPLTSPRRLRISSSDQAGNISLIVVSFSAYFRLSARNSSDSLTLGVDVGDVGFSAGATLREDLCGTRERAGRVCGGADIAELESFRLVQVREIST